VNQSRSHSLIEATANTASGFALSMLAVQFVFPIIGVRMDMGQNIAATAIMILVSLARSYFWRRVFSRYGRRG